MPFPMKCNPGAELSARTDLDDRVQEINSLHESLQRQVRTTIETAIQIGGLLTEQKAKLNHGEWLPWCAENLKFDRTTGFRYMRLHGNREMLQGATSLVEVYRLLSATDEPEPEEDPTPDATESSPSEYFAPSENATPPATTGANFPSATGPAKWLKDREREQRMERRGATVEAESEVVPSDPEPEGGEEEISIPPKPPRPCEANRIVNDAMEILGEIQDRDEEWDSAWGRLERYIQNKRAEGQPN